MELRILKYGNLAGSPDVKEMLFRAGPGTPPAQALWQDLFAIKRALGLNGQSTTALLLEPAIPSAFPAIVDFSFISAAPESHNDSSVQAALASLGEQGLSPKEIKSLLCTHLHPDHFDARLTSHLTEATVFVPPDTRVPGSAPFSPAHFDGLVDMVATPGHGGPHCSYLFDLPELDLSVCLAGDLIMSHAHYLSPDHPLSFTDAAEGQASIELVKHALAARGRRFRTVVPGHDIPFFVQTE
jgi:glyoxylase-like metal-dependent hydrolase (beta-lactamase superfamily II)